MMSTLAEINHGWPNTCPDLQALLSKSSPSEPWAKLHLKAVACNRVSTPSWLLDWEIINKVSELGTVVIDCSSDPFNGHEKTLVEWLSPKISDFVILSADARYLSEPADHICYFPYFFLCVLSQTPHTDDIITNSKREYAVSCLNKRARTHRIENWLKIKDKPWFNRCLFSMHNEFDLDSEKRDSGLNFSDEKFLDKWLELALTLPRIHQNDMTAQHPAYWDSYINLVTETSVLSQEIFFSEKTFKPLISGQMAIWLGMRGMVSFLRDLGFDLFDDYINHEYDLNENWHQRIDMIHLQLEKLMSLDLEKIFDSTQVRRLKNKEFLYSKKLNDRLTQQCNYYSGIIK